MPPRAAQGAIADAAPEPVTVQAVIDTGARKTYIKKGVLDPLNIHPIGIGAANTASHHHVICPIYAIRLIFPNGPAVDPISVFEGPEDGLFGDTTQALIGRDVLRYGLFIYMGTEGLFTLSF